MMKTEPRPRLTLRTAALEFGIDHRTLESRLAKASIESGKDGKFWPSQIAEAIYSDIQGERLRKTREEADNLALRNEDLRRRLVDVEAVKLLSAAFADAVKQIIDDSALEAAAKAEIADILNAMRQTNYGAEPTTLSKPGNAAN